MRRKDISWSLPDGDLTYDAAAIAVLMDIRDELKTITVALRPLQQLSCPNFIDIPHKLDRIRRNTTPKKRVRK